MEALGRLWRGLTVIWYNVIVQFIPLAIGASVGFFVGKMTVPPTGIDDLKWKILSSILGALVVDKLWTVGRKLEQRMVNAAIDRANEAFENKLNDLLDEHIDPLSASLERFSPYFAFRTEHGRLESLMRQAETIQSKAKWVVPLFVSHKLSQDFNSGTEVLISTDSTGYSDIIQELLPFATHSIYMTCPYTPRQWFEELLHDEPETLQQALAGDLADSQFPAHVRAFLGANVRDAKKRFVVLPAGTLADFFAPVNRPALRCFLKFANSEYQMETRFAYEETLCDGCASPCDVATADYQVWDRSAVIEWGRPGREATDRPLPDQAACRLMLDPEVKYLKVFDRCFNVRGRTVKSDDLLRWLDELENGDGSEAREVWGVRFGQSGLISEEADAGRANA